MPNPLGRRGRSLDEDEGQRDKGGRHIKRGQGRIDGQRQKQEIIKP